MMLAPLIQALLDSCELISQKGFSPATGGNFSVRATQDTMMISASGKDKRKITEHDFVVCDFNANLLSGEGKPSAEAYLHGLIYQLAPTTNCVLHTHSIASTVLSMHKSKEMHFSFQGYEMQKVIAGIISHEDNLDLYIFDNDQNMPRLAQAVKELWPRIHMAHGFVVRGHGLYSWGSSIFEATRHMEGLEFLFQCELAKAQIK